MKDHWSRPCWHPLGLDALELSVVKCLFVMGNVAKPFATFVEAAFSSVSDICI